MHKSNELAGRVALVTGAGRNIGRSIALALAADGATVAVNTRASRDDAEKVVQEIRAAGGKAQVFFADITAPDQVGTMTDAVVSGLGKIDILVLNASVRREVPFVDMDFDEWRKVMSTSLDGSFHCIKACLPSMIAAGSGNIIMLAGDTALAGAVGKAHSSAAKSGLVGLTKALAKELAQHGIRVNCVSPGNINTTLPAYRAERPAASGRIPMGRQGEPEEIAATVRFLCTPGAGYITGQTVHVNGGLYMPG